jgi:hypothetical protein
MEGARKVEQALHAFSWAIFIRAASRTEAGRTLDPYTVRTIVSTMAPISGRKRHTRAASPPGPSGTSIRAMPASLRARRGTPARIVLAHASRSVRCSPTRMAFAIAVSAGLTAPMLGKKLVSTT